MGNRLYFSFIQKQCSLDQCFAVSGGAGVNDLDTFRKLTVDLLDCPDRCSQRISVIVMIEGIQQRSIFTYQCCLCCSGTCIDSKKSLSLVRSKVFDRNLMFCMAESEFLVICRRCKQGFQTLHFKFQFDFICQTALKCLQRNIHIPFGIQRGTDCCKQMRMIRSDNMLIVQF